MAEPTAGAPPAPRPRRRRVYVLLSAILLAVLLVAGGALALAWRNLGRAPRGARLARILASPNYRDGRFRSPLPVRPYTLASAWEMARDYLGGQERVPRATPPTERRVRADYAPPPASGLRVTWLGHSSALVELDGAAILLDPIFGERLSPLPFVGPERFFPSPVAVEALPPLRAVVISHDHYDHLDRASVLALAGRTERFVTPLGVGEHLEYWGIPAEKIVELDWWEELSLGDGLRVVACPARHFSGRGFSGDRTEWASFALVGPRHRVFFSGDTGLMPQFAEVGDRLGPFDVTLVKIGAYGRGWPDIHVDPEQAVRLHELVRGRLMVPIHWGTVNLSYHAWTEPAERLLVAARTRGVAVALPRPGQLLDPAAPPPAERWWPEVPWQRDPGAEARADEPLRPR